MHSLSLSLVLVICSVVMAQTNSSHSKNPLTPTPEGTGFRRYGIFPRGARRKIGQRLQDGTESGPRSHGYSRLSE